MGFLYEKSRSESFRSYFSQDDSFEKDFNQFNLIDQSIIQGKSRAFLLDGNISGVPMAYDEKEKVVYIDHSDAHSLIIGPTGSKKTRLIAMPTVRILAKGGESIIISDPKAEIYMRTAEYLEQQGYEINVINLREPSHSKRWNPLYIPYMLYCKGEIDKACEFANDISKNMMSNSLEKDPFWQNSAASLLFGLIMLLFMYCKEHDLSVEDVNFTNIFELRNILFSESGFSANDSLLWKYAQKDPIIRNSLIGTVETAKDTRGGILSTFDQSMRDISIQPNLLDMLSQNEINLDECICSKYALYIIMPDEKTSYHKLVSLFIKQSYEYLISLAQTGMYDSGLRVGTLPVRINFVLDEFSSLPTVADFPAMITAARSRNIRFMLFVQSKHQLTQRYQDETETIIANCINWIFLTTREISLLEDLSKLCGMKDQKPILPISQLQRLDKDEGEALILCGRKKPYIAKLPDIKDYDKNKYSIIAIKENVASSRPALDFQRLMNKEGIKVPPHISSLPMPELLEPNVKLENLTNEDIDRMIKAIDDKLKEIEDQEKGENKDDK